MTVDPSGSSGLINIRFVKQVWFCKWKTLKDSMRRKKRCGSEGSDWTTAWVFQDCLIVIWFGGDYTFARGSSCSKSMDRVVRFLSYRRFVTRRQGTEMAVGSKGRYGRKSRGYMKSTSRD